MLIFVLGTLYGTRFYIPWPDETLMVEVSENLVQRGFLGAPSLTGSGLHFDENIFLYSPAYFLWLGSWFKIVQSSLLNARLLSNIMGVVSLSAIFGFAMLLFRQNLLPGLIVLLLALEVHYAWLYNWARPDIMALTCSYVAVWLYLYGFKQRKNHFLIFFTISWIIAVLGMITHPVGGLLGFTCIPLHLLISRDEIVKDRRTWFLLICVPLLALALWGIYILQAPEFFWEQFMEFQIPRKLDRFANFGTIFRLILITLENKGIKSSLSLNESLAPIVWIGLVLMVWKEKHPSRPFLMLLLLTFFSTAVVTFGSEMMYPPLRLPSYFLGLGIILKIAEIRWLNSDNSIQKQWFRKSIKILIYVGFIGLMIVTGKKTYERIWEVRYSERAQAYNPESLANAIIRVVEPGASLGIRIFPDCYDLLADSGQFSEVRRLTWLKLSKDELEKYIIQNEYLALTDSVLNPLSSGSKIDLTTSNWGGDAFREAANKYYLIYNTLELPKGGVTIIYKKKVIQP